MKAMSLVFRPVTAQPRRIVLLVYCPGLTAVRIADLWGCQPFPGCSLMLTTSKWIHPFFKGKRLLR